MVRKILLLIGPLSLLLSISALCESWQRLGAPPVGRADDISPGIDGAVKIIYAADVTRRLYKSVNGATSWDSISAQEALSPLCAVTEPNNARVVYVGRPELGVWKSEDQGDHWWEKNIGLDNLKTRCFVMDPVTPSTVYLGCDWVGPTAHALFKTINGGDNWTGLSLPNPYGSGVTALAIDPQNSQTIYACEWQVPYEGLYRSVNGGVDWSLILPDIRFYSVAVDPQNQQIIYAGYQGGVKRSTDGGSNWDTVLEGVSQVNSIVIDPDQPSTVYAGATTGVYRSLDWGDNWNSFNEGLVCTNILSLAIDPQDLQTVYAGSIWCLYRLGAGQDVWVECTKGMRPNAITTIAPKLPRIYATGKSWTLVHRSDQCGEDWISTCSFWGDPKDMVVNPDYPDIAFVASYTGLPCGVGERGVIQRTTDGGYEWVSVYDPMPPDTEIVPVNCLTLHPQSPDVIYAGYDYVETIDIVGIVKSTNNGDDWFLKNNGFAPNDALSLAIDPVSVYPDKVYAGSRQSGVYKTENGGDLWAQTSLTSVQVDALVVDPITTETVYAGTPDGIYKTIDGGDNWTQVNEGLVYDSVGLLAVDPEEPTIVYTGCHDEKQYAHVYLTVDGAAQWIDISDGLPEDPVKDLEIDTDRADTTWAGTPKGLFIFVPPFHKSLVSSSPLSTAYNNGRKLVREPETENLHLVYESGGRIYYTSSTDGGDSWSRKFEVGEGYFPAISLDCSSQPNVVWVSKWDVFGGSNLYWRKRGPSAQWLSERKLLWWVPDKLDPPSFVVDHTDSGRVVLDLHYKEPNGYNAICYGDFYTQDPNPTLSHLTVLDQAWAPPGCGRPAIDYQATEIQPVLHTVYDKEGSIYYAWKDHAGWHLPAQAIPVNPPNCNPSIEVTTGDVYCVWEHSSPGDILHAVKTPTGWNTTVVYSSSQDSRFPVVSEGWNVVWQEELTGNWEIYFSQGPGPWSPPSNLSNTEEESRFAHSNYCPISPQAALHTIWTENDNAPYRIEFANHDVEPVPLYYADLGQEEPSRFTIQREGYIQYGSESYKTIDYHPDELIYRMPDLNPGRKYQLDVVYYHEGSGEWKERLVVDGIPMDNSKVEPHTRVVVSKWLPEATYLDEEIKVTVARVSGDYAILAQLFLYEFERPGEGGSQSARGASLRIPKDYGLRQNYPNPLSRSTIINYQVPMPVNTTLKVYNVTGSLVKTVVDEQTQPGYYSVTWDGKDELGRRVAGGIYFYRLEAGSFTHTNKMVVLK